MHDDPLRLPEVPQIELERSIEDLVRRAHRVLEVQGRLRGLLSASRAVSDDLDLEHVLRHIAGAALELSRAELGVLALLRPDGSCERCIHVGVDGGGHDAGHHAAEHDALVALVGGETALRIDDVATDPRATGLPAARPPIRSLLAVPVRVRDAVFGALCLVNARGSRFTADDEALVLSLAATASAAIDNARLYEESVATQRLGSAVEALTANLLDPDVDDGLDRVAAHAGALVAADAAAVLAPAARGEPSACHARWGADGRDLAAALLHEGASMVGRAADGARIRLGPGSAERPPAGSLADSALLLVPLAMPSGVDGALALARGDGGSPFEPSDLEMADAFARRAGLALELGRARSDRQRLEIVEDRARIARDLHDHAIQRLFGTGLGLRALASARSADAGAIAMHVREIEAAVVDIRSAIFMLEPRSPRETPSDLLRAVLTEIAPSLTGAPAIRLDGAIDAALHGTLLDDVVAVLRESLANVVRHARATATSIEVSVTATRVAVTVTDDGVGIGPQDAAARSSGLTNLAARATARHGTFTLESMPAGGTRARWSAPIDAPTEGPPTRVFVVDDHEIARRGVAQLLGAHRDLVLVGEASAVQGTAERVLDLRPDVVLIDVHLADGNGVDLCRTIRAASDDVHCLLLSAFDDATAELAATLAGASGWIRKDASGHVLLEGLRRAARGRAAADRRVDAAVEQHVVNLTLRERQALRLITEGLTNRQIGARLGITEKTVKNYVSSLLGKLGMERRTQVASYGAIAHGRGQALDGASHPRP